MYYAEVLVAKKNSLSKQIDRLFTDKIGFVYAILRAESP
jgi:hypothetical protein